MAFVANQSQYRVTKGNLRQKALTIGFLSVSRNSWGRNDAGDLRADAFAGFICCDDGPHIVLSLVLDHNLPMIRLDRNQTVMIRGIEVWVDRPVVLQDSRTVSRHISNRWIAPLDQVGRMSSPNVRHSKTCPSAMSLFVKAMAQDNGSLWDGIPLRSYAFDVAEIPGAIRRVDDVVFQMFVIARCFLVRCYIDENAGLHYKTERTFEW